MSTLEFSIEFQECGKDLEHFSLSNDLMAEIAAIMARRVLQERDRCCQIVYGQCGSDNVAERTVRAIRAPRNPSLLHSEGRMK